MKKNIIIFILIILIIIISFAFFIREAINLNKINKLESKMLDKEHAYEITLTDFISDYDSLFKNYQAFLEKYRKQAEQYKKQTDNETGYWGEYEVTAYSQESGTITSTGIDLNSRYAKYLNIAAVDPQVIEYGSILLIKFADGSVKAFIAADCGGLIKGKKLDLYFTDKEEAIQFGRQKLLVKVIK